jgi:hypothetical protein
MTFTNARSRDVLKLLRWVMRVHVMAGLSIRSVMLENSEVVEEVLHL